MFWRMNQALASLYNFLGHGYSKVSLNTTWLLIHFALWMESLVTPSGLDGFPENKLIRFDIVASDEYFSSFKDYRGWLRPWIGLKGQKFYNFTTWERKWKRLYLSGLWTDLDKRTFQNTIIYYYLWHTLVSDYQTTSWWSTKAEHINWAPISVGVGGTSRISQSAPYRIWSNENWLWSLWWIWTSWGCRWSFKSREQVPVTL